MNQNCAAWPGTGARRPQRLTLPPSVLLQAPAQVEGLLPGGVGVREGLPQLAHGVDVVVEDAEAGVQLEGQAVQLALQLAPVDRLPVPLGQVQLLRPHQVVHGADAPQVGPLGGLALGVTPPEGVPQGGGGHQGHDLGLVLPAGEGLDGHGEAGELLESGPGGAPPGCPPRSRCGRGGGAGPGARRPWGGRRRLLGRGAGGEGAEGGAAGEEGVAAGAEVAAGASQRHGGHLSPPGTRAGRGCPPGGARGQGLRGVRPRGRSGSCGGGRSRGTWPGPPRSGRSRSRGRWGGRWRRSPPAAGCGRSRWRTAPRTPGTP